MCLYIFMSLVRSASFLIVKNSCVREELIDLPFFLQTQLQQITEKRGILINMTVGHKYAKVDLSINMKRNTSSKIGNHART